MKIIIQRVSRAAVTIDGGERRETGHGLLLFVGIRPGDSDKTAAFLADKAANLRIFKDENDNMNLSLLDVGGEAMVISNFTLYANSRKGRRPSFAGAAGPDEAEPLYKKFVEHLRTAGVKRVATGEFGAHMDVELVNDGPVTIILDSEDFPI